jgi:hypothetical protein
MKKESQETVITAVPTSSSSQNIINNHIMHTPISVGVPSLPHNSFVIPAASLQVVLKKAESEYENFYFTFKHFTKLYFLSYIQSPLHQTMELLANRLTSTDQYNATIYATLVDQWMHYYANNPDQVINHLQMNQFQQEVMMNQSAVNIQRQTIQVPLEMQNIV